MKYLQSIALLLALLSALVNVYALFCLLKGIFPELPSFLWVLHVGVFVCFGPAVFIRRKRLNNNSKAHSLGMETPFDGEAMWEGISKLPFILLWVYGISSFFLQTQFENSTEDEPWLFFSIGWMAFYYISWAMLRNERAHQASV